MGRLLFTSLLGCFLILCLCPFNGPQRPNIVETRGHQGFWELAKDQNRVWWFQSPQGQLEFINAVTTIQPYQKGIDPHDVGFHSSDYNGDIDQWAKKTVKRVQETGFKASGAWSNPAISEYIPYSKDLNLLKGSKIPLTDPAWESEMTSTIKSQVVPLRDDKNLIGYFLDNELAWDADPILAQNADKYFEVTAKLIRKYDPDHLILGVRMNRRAPLNVIYAMRGHTDVESVNVYSDTGTLWTNNIKELYTITGCPVMVSEFSFWARENDSNDTSSKAWWNGVQTQKQRAAMYHQFVLGVADNSFMIGCDFFQWSDEPSSGRLPDGENINCGIVSVHDHPYPAMVAAVQDASARVNKIHAASNELQQNAIWKADPSRL